MLNLGVYRHNKTKGEYKVLGLVYTMSDTEIANKTVSDTLLVINATDSKHETIYKDKHKDIYYVTTDFKLERVLYLYSNKEANLYIRGVNEFHEDVEIEDKENECYTTVRRFELL